ncbi:DEAD-domain-containing protein [Aureobasidium sp. EXF-8845]|nr:DEAD-domain-containing protein [Aureobasidium sp. EXF-8845]KAI4857531.1 DEAD-domain-containing protein [Aureobasidium sp. EXF-8846]
MSSNAAGQQFTTSEAATIANRQPSKETLELGQDARSGTHLPKTFRELGIVETLCDACQRIGYEVPTSIQSQSIPLALQGRDIVGLAETGSGKTAAFVLPILQALLSSPQSLHTLIIAPTRELAQQIAHVVEALGSIVAVKCVLLIGGVDMVSQAIGLGKKPHIVVATPGRLLDHLENTKGFSFRNLKYLVLDEADRLLDLDFGPIIDKILKTLPKRITFLFSATLSSKVESLQRACLSDPIRVSTSSDRQTVSTLLQSYMFVPQKQKDVHLVHFLNDRAGQTTIIFTRTVNETQRLSYLLWALGFSAIPIHGQLAQSMRLGALNKFRSDSRSILVATDVAARGLDIPSVDVVINFDLPGDSATYIHRVGRTARAGKSGTAISFVTQYDVEIWLRIENALKKKLKDVKPDRAEVMVFLDRVGDAQRTANSEMKEFHEKRNEGRGPKRKRDRMDEDEG